MTAQIGDVYKYKGTRYTLVASSANMPFSPEYYGLEPEGICTACWNGYWCEYKIDGELYLKNLYVNCRDDYYPPLNGIQVSPMEYEEVEAFSMGKGKHKTTIPKHMGHHVYQDLGLFVPYSGNILIGDGFLFEYYIHMGLQRPFAYSTLLELVFLNGTLIEEYNRSDIAQKLRELYDSRRTGADKDTEPPPQEELPDLWWL